MEEDFVGTHREIHIIKPSICERCGNEVPGHEVSRVPGELIPGTDSEEAEICARCLDDLGLGPANPPR